MIFVLVPAYNEAPTVGLLLWKVRQVFTAFPREYQLLVVNDGSTDGTDEVLAPYTRALPLTLVTHRERKGYGRSVEELLRLAVSRTDRPRRDLAVLLQADFSDSPDDIPELVRRIESGADLALADYRRRPGLGWLDALARRLVSRARRRSGPGDQPADCVCTLKAMRIVTLARTFSERGSHAVVQADGWAADAELLLAAARHARRVDVVPVTSPVPVRRRPRRARPLRSAWAAWQVLRRQRRADAPQQPVAGPRPRGRRARLERGEARAQPPESVRSA
jgi:glycosyltransferase involved in cell wall biosynthesis